MKKSAYIYWLIGDILFVEKILWVSNIWEPILSHSRPFHMLPPPLKSISSLFFFYKSPAIYKQLLSIVYPFSAIDICILSGKIDQKLYCLKINSLIFHYVKHTLTIWPTIPLLSIYPRHMEAHVNKMIWMWVFWVALFVKVKNWKQLNAHY